MKCPIISHSHDGIRVNIDGVADVFSSPVQLAEAYARHKATCQTIADIVRSKSETLSRAVGRSDFDKGDPTHCQALHDAASALLPELISLLEHCRR